MAERLADEQAIFEVARKIDLRDARQAYLQQTCGDDQELMQRVAALLRAYEESESFMESPPPGLDDSPSGLDVSVTFDRHITEKPGTVIGPYKLLQQIGEGGMGTVFMAEQTKPIQRKVALKVIKPGMDSRQVIARFEAERQALAMMDHVNIARVLDAGTTESGLPYFVMELVNGVPITKYCDDNNLTPRERLELFVPVCQAIQHAHQKGIIHRDIKPSNVMITLYDGKPVPKVIDFGVAKATEQKLTELTLFTQYGTMVGTLEYMSPEQAEMSALGADTRSDIYSLGVLLYELLTGSTPLSNKRMKEAAYAEILRMIKEEEPPKPSTRLSESGESLASISAQRHMDPAKLTKLVRGELDWIVMKTLEKDRSRRYETATGLAEDIGRYLADEQVQACPPSAGYRLKKFIRRNKSAVLAGSAIVAALIVGLAVASLGLVQARREAIRADRAAEIAQTQEQLAHTQAVRSDQVAQFLKDMLEGVGPSMARGRDTTMLREIVDRTAERIRTDLQSQPEVEAELRLTLGHVYLQLQLYRKAEETARETLQLARADLGEENVAVADALGQVGRALMFLRTLNDAENFTRQAIAMQRKLRGADSIQEADSLANLGDILRHQYTVHPEEQNKLVEAETAARAGLAIRRKRLGNESTEVAWALRGLAIVFRVQGRLSEAEAADREALAIHQKIYGDEHPYTRDNLAALANTLTREDKLDEAETYYRKCLGIIKRAESDEKWDHADFHREFAVLLQKKGQLIEAEGEYRQVLAIARRMMGGNHVELVKFMAGSANILRSNGKPAEARPLADEAMAICQQHPNEVERWMQDRAFAVLGDILADLNDTAAQQVLAEELVKHAELTGNADQLANAYTRAIHLLVSSKRHEQAKSVCRKLASLTPQNGSADNYVAWLLATGEDPADRDPEMAVELARKAVELNPKASGWWNTLGVANYRAGDWREAIDALKKSEELEPGESTNPNAFFLAMAHCQLDEQDDARRWYGQAVEWMEKEKRQDDVQLRRFRAEAEELLKITDQKPATKQESK